MSLPIYFGHYPLVEKSTANQYKAILDKLDIEYKYDEKRNYMELRTDDPLFILSLLSITPETFPNWRAPNSNWKHPINAFLLGKKTPPNPPPGAVM